MSQPLDLRANGPYKTKETSDQLTPNLFANKSAAIISFFSLAWHGRKGIEPTTSGFGDRIATLVHAPVYKCGFVSPACVTPGTAYEEFTPWKSWYSPQLMHRGAAYVRRAGICRPHSQHSYKRPPVL